MSKELTGLDAIKAEARRRHGEGQRAQDFIEGAKRARCSDRHRKHGSGRRSVAQVKEKGVTIGKYRAFWWDGYEAKAFRP